MNREDFEMVNNYIYFDNSATTLKPKQLAEETSDYYNKYTANVHRGDYDLSMMVDDKYEETRTLVKGFINARKNEEIVFTSGTTDSINKIVFGYFKNHLHEGDEILLSKAEHASNVLPWFELAKELKLVISYIDIVDNQITIQNVAKAITSKTKVISIAHITNVLGDIRPIKEIISLAHKNNILVLIDGAASVSHIDVDVQDLDIDFLAFSAHKMLGPTGVGVLYGKEELLNETKPIIFGGDMNAWYYDDMKVQYSSLPTKLEAGTTNIAGIIGFGVAIKYLNEIGMKKIHDYEKELKEYLVDQLRLIKDIIIYNENSESGIITINHNDIFAQDLAVILNKYKICVRAGNHCAKLTNSITGVKNTVRISLYFYNTKEEIDRLIEILRKENLKNEII